MGAIGYPKTMTDAQWRAHSDARTLMEAEKIKKDAKRLKAAKACAKKMLAEAQAEVAAARKLAS